MGVTTALVLSAGGMFSAWEAGVWKALHGRVQFDLIVGASAGALNGWAIAGACPPEELIREWLDPATASILKLSPHLRGLVRPDALQERARMLFTRYHPQVPFGLTLVEVPRMQLRLVRDAEITWRHLAAACSIPVVFPPVRIEGRSYVDGGLLGALPLWAAEEMGARRAIAVNALTSFPFRAARKLIRPRRASAALAVVRIEPSAPLGSLVDAVRWSRSNIERWIELGERDGYRALRSITM